MCISLITGEVFSSLVAGCYIACFGKKASVVELPHFSHFLKSFSRTVPGRETCDLVNVSVEERVGLGIPDVEDLTRDGHVAGDALAARKTNLLTGLKKKK